MSDAGHTPLNELARMILGVWGDKDQVNRHTEMVRQRLDLPDETSKEIEDPVHEAWIKASQSSPTEAEKILREALAPDGPVISPLRDWLNHDLPRPILWRDDDRDDDTDASRRDAVLSCGEVAVLSAEGGLGKSTLTLELAVAAARAEVNKSSTAAACGLRVQAGPVVLVSYEDSPVRIVSRVKWMTDSQHVYHHVHVWDDPVPLWQGRGDEGRGQGQACAQWPSLWQRIRKIGACLVVIDPASAALIDIDVSQTGPVRAFLRALTCEAKPQDEWDGCGVLVVAHSTKAGRRQIAAGESPGADVIAGSAAWYDGARGVLTMARCPYQLDVRLLWCAKANYGRSGWGVVLAERESGVFRGLIAHEDTDNAEGDLASWHEEAPRRRKKRDGDAKKDRERPLNVIDD